MASELEEAVDDQQAFADEVGDEFAKRGLLADSTDGAAELEKLPEGESDDDLLARIYNAERVCRQKEAVVDDLKEELKLAKAELEGAVLKLRKLCSQVQSDEEYMANRPLLQQQEKAQQAEDGPQEWESVRMDWFLEQCEIEGLGAKKHEALCDLCPTLGAFERVRAKVGSEADSLHRLLPQGFGEAITDKLENCFLDFIADYVPPTDDEGNDEDDEDEE